MFYQKIVWHIETLLSKLFYYHSPAAGQGYLTFHINNPAGGSAFVYSAPFYPTVGQWHHIALTRSAGAYSFYVDGAITGSSSNAVFIPDSAAPVTIGQSENLGFLNGKMDEIEIVNRALSSSEILSIFQAGTAGKCKQAPATPLTMTTKLSPSPQPCTGTNCQQYEYRNAILSVPFVTISTAANVLAQTGGTIYTVYPSTQFPGQLVARQVPPTEVLVPGKLYQVYPQNEVTLTLSGQALTSPQTIHLSNSAIPGKDTTGPSRQDNQFSFVLKPTQIKTIGDLRAAIGSSKIYCLYDARIGITPCETDFVDTDPITPQMAFSVIMRSGETFDLTYTGVPWTQSELNPLNFKIDASTLMAGQKLHMPVPFQTTQTVKTALDPLSSTTRAWVFKSDVVSAGSCAVGVSAPETEVLQVGSGYMIYGQKGGIVTLTGTPAAPTQTIRLGTGGCDIYSLGGGAYTRLQNLISFPVKPNEFKTVGEFRTKLGITVGCIGDPATQGPSFSQSCDGREYSDATPIHPRLVYSISTSPISASEPNPLVLTYTGTPWTQAELDSPAPGRVDYNPVIIVKDPTGAPVVNAKVMIDFRNGGRFQQRPTVVTDSTGTARFATGTVGSPAIPAGIPAGDYEINVSQPTGGNYKLAPNTNADVISRTLYTFAYTTPKGTDQVAVTVEKNVVTVTDLKTVSVTLTDATTGTSQIVLQNAGTSTITSAKAGVLFFGTKYYWFHYISVPIPTGGLVPGQTATFFVSVPKPASITANGDWGCMPLGVSLTYPDCAVIPAGTYTLTGRADPQNELPDSNRANNDAKATITLASPANALVPQDVTMIVGSSQTLSGVTIKLQSIDATAGSAKLTVTPSTSPKSGTPTGQAVRVIYSRQPSGSGRFWTWIKSWFS